MGRRTSSNSQPLMLGKSSLFEPVDRIVQSSQSAPNSPANSRKNKLQRCSICGAPPCPPAAVAPSASPAPPALLYPRASPAPATPCRAQARSGTSRAPATRWAPNSRRPPPPSARPPARRRLAVRRGASGRRRRRRETPRREPMVPSARRRGGVAGARCSPARPSATRRRRRRRSRDRLVRLRRRRGERRGTRAAGARRAARADGRAPDGARRRAGDPRRRRHVTLDLSVGVELSLLFSPRARIFGYGCEHDFFGNRQYRQGVGLWTDIWKWWRRLAASRPPPTRGLPAVYGSIFRRTCRARVVCRVSIGARPRDTRALPRAGAFF